VAPTLWLVRHAPTRDNLDGVIMGQGDPDALVDGLDRAARLLRGVPIAFAVSSDARRAQATARAIVPDLPLCLDARLRERSFGEWEGRSKAELRATHPDALTATGAVRLDADLPGLEPLSALCARVRAALADLRDLRHPVLVVAHNGPLRVAMILLALADLDDAARTSFPHLSPVAADLARLSDP
jgi:broad specificity phosphatase PhoE